MGPIPSKFRQGRRLTLAEFIHIVKDLQMTSVLFG